MQQAKKARDLVQKALKRLDIRPELEEECADLKAALDLLNPLADGIQMVDSGDPAIVAMRSVVSNKHVPAELQLDLMSYVEDIEDVSEGGRPRLFMALFRLLHRWSLLDPLLAKNSSVSFYKAGTWLAEQLQKSGHVTVERLKDIKTVAEAKERCGEENVEVADILVAPGGWEVARVQRPFIKVEENVYQKALVLRGVPTDDAVAVGFDEVLFPAEDGLRRWEAGLHVKVRGMLKEKQRQALERALVRIPEARATMLQAAKDKKPVAPPDTARRDLTKLAIDMVHRVQDTIATLPQHRVAYKGAFAEMIFQDVVFRGLVPYLSREFGIDLDTAVVEGADSQALSGRFTKENDGLKPTHPSSNIFSVVIPGYLQGGVTIRPAAVRLGVFA